MSKTVIHKSLIRRIPLLLFSIGLTILSCSKSANEAPKHSVGKLKQVQSIGYGGTSKTEYKYDSKGFLRSIDYTATDGILYSRQEFTNDSIGRPVLAYIYTIKTGEAPKKTHTVTYTYKDNRLIEYKQRRLVPEASFDYTQKYSYNNQNFLESSTVTADGDPQNLHVYQTFEYTVDSKGIITGQTRKTFPTGPTATVAITSEKYEYDDKVNPYPSNYPEIYRPHNTIKVTVKHDIIPNEIVTLFAFDYNQDGLPIKEYVVENGSRRETKIYEYY
jgi:hypothetical protein